MAAADVKDSAFLSSQKPPSPSQQSKEKPAEKLPSKQNHPTALQQPEHKVAVRKRPARKRIYTSSEAELSSLNHSDQKRIKFTQRLCGAWLGVILLTSIGLFLAKPYFKKKRLERLKDPNYKSPVTPKKYPPIMYTDTPDD